MCRMTNDQVIIQAAGEIRSLPAGDFKLNAARQLCRTSAQNNPGKEALTAMADTLALALEGASPNGDAWIDLADLARTARGSDVKASPAFDLATDFLTLRDMVYLESTLSGLD